MRWVSEERIQAGGKRFKFTWRLMGPSQCPENAQSDLLRELFECESGAGGK
jgi:hypothetical protein